MRRSVLLPGLALGLYLVSLATQAGAICVTACAGGGTLGHGSGLVNPGGGTGGAPVTPPLFVPLIHSIDHANLSLSGTSLIILDQALLPELPGIAIAPGIPVYANASEIPEAQRLPADFVLVNSAVSGDTTFAGLTSRFVIVSGFGWPATVTIAAASGVAFLDTAALIATPVPATACMLLPCLFYLWRRRFPAV